MKKEWSNNDKIPSPDDFWPEANELLDKHFKAKKRRGAFLKMGGFMLVFAAVMMFVFNDEIKKTDNLKLRSANSALPINTGNQKELNEKNVSNVIAETISLHASEWSKNKPLETEKLNKNGSTIVKQQAIHVANKLINNTSNKLVAEGDNEQLVAIENNYKNNELKKNNELAALAIVDNTAKLNTDEKILKSNTVLDLIGPLPRTMKEVQRLNNMGFTAMENDLENQPTIIVNTANLVPVDGDDYATKSNYIKYAISAYGGFQQVDKTLQANQIFSEYAAIRSVKETKTNTLFYGVNFTLQKNNFVVKAGVEYNTFSENNQYDATSKKWQITDESKWNIYNKQVLKIDTIYHFGIVNYVSSLVSVRDSTLQIKSDSVFAYGVNNKIIEANGKTKLSYIEIPLMVGYEFKKNKFSVSPLVGISVGYLIAERGSYINQSITGIENISAIQEIKKYMFNYSLQLQVGYRLSPQFMVFIAPQFKANLLSVTNKNFGVSTRYQTIGGLIGLNFALN